jgi:hypothetical protein
LRRVGRCAFEVETRRMEECALLARRRLAAAGHVLGSACKFRAMFTRRLSLANDRGRDPDNETTGAG